MKNLQDTNHIQLILQSSIFNNLNQYYFDKFLYYLKLKELKENSYMLKGKKINGWSINEKRGNKLYEQYDGLEWN